MIAIDRLITHSPNGELDPFDHAMMVTAITDLAKKGWTEDEIVSMLKWTEHVNPLIDEDVAIRNMKRIKAQVEARMETV